ncbi:uncharacterized protein LOC100838098 [Brachypodium distachyon]|uniref:Uncharacterized protein n=1 Tax=Brachypodium distachyon TaxID=15368 RepID=I1HZB7_BRADI|nr:uncharacterized protein LOC100838098 [Brachypodium distachyon]KQJ94283.1 hypothetical protein BRADI_3g09680v3 [Brachypodium distachyon]|eukprot:XP_010234111.1 uncharacterized protein LOC100838098 [Brachypodium distachyon]
MAEFPVVLPPLAVVDGVGRRNKKRAGGLPKLLHKFFFKVLRLRPTSSSSVSEQSAAAAAFEAYYGYRMVDECYYYSYGGAGSASWAGVLFSIPEEDSSEEGTPGSDAAAVRPSALRKAHSDSERFLAAEAAAVVHLELEVVL